jgi:hypothetical protein
MADLAVAKTSKQFSLQLNDFWKGLLVAVISPVFTIVIGSLNAGSLTFDWKAIGITALTALLAYLSKNFFTPAQTVISGAPKEGVVTTVTIPPADTAVKPTIVETKKP